MNYLWRIELFGGLRAVFNPTSTGQIAPQTIERFRTQKTASLLAYLALHFKTHPREVLTDLLWPEHNPKTGSQSLRTSLYSLRKQLEPPGVPENTVLLANRSQVQLNPQLVTSDVVEFRAALHDARSELEHLRRIEHYERAISLYTGRFLPGVYNEWALREAECLEKEYFDALSQVINYFESERDPARAAYYATLGARSTDAPDEIIAAFERLTPKGKTTVASPKVRAELPVAQQEHETTPPKPISQAHVMLPPQFTRFFGREAEIALLHDQLLDAGIRLITLTGSGGSGKTRLVIEATRRLIEQYAHKTAGSDWPQLICFIPLADVRNAELVATTILNALELPRFNQALPAAVNSHVEQLIAALQVQPPLLVIDNFEHVSSAATLLEVLLMRVPDLKILVTSQQRLYIAGECELPVDALPVPQPDDEWQQIIASPSVQLFVDRAQSARPDFQITRHNADDIVRLCVGLEGVPLAIELAAARAGVLTASQIACQLEQLQTTAGGRLDFLHYQRRPATPRHLSLRTTVSWSHSLLPPELAGFWALLAVFRGGFSVEAAEAICQQPGALHILGQLRACSLLVIEERNKSIRFRLPELLREFAREQLEAQPGAALVRKRHAEYFCDFMADTVLRLRTPDEPQALQQAAVEANNARAALDWAHSSEEYSLCATISLSLGTTLQRRGLHREALGYFQKGIEAIAHLPEDYNSLRIELLRESAGVHLDLMEWTSARRDAKTLYGLCHRIKDKKGIAEATNLLGLAAKNSKQWKRARDYFEQARALFDEIEDTSGLANAYNNLGLIEYLDPNGDKAAAVAYIRQALHLRWTINDLRGVGEAFVNLGALAHLHGDLTEAQRYYIEALGIEMRLNHPFGIARVLCNLGEVMEDNNLVEKAFRLYIAAQYLFKSSGAAYQEYSAERASHLADNIESTEILEQTARSLVAKNDIRSLIDWAEVPL